MDDWLKWTIAIAVAVVLFFVRRGSREAGYALGRKLRGGRDPKPLPRWVYVLFGVGGLALAVYGFSRGTDVVGGADGYRDRPWWIFGALGALTAVGAVIELRKKRSARPD